MNILVLQHIKIEDPGFIKDLMLRDKCNLEVIELDEGEKIPANLSNFDAMLSMGGPMDTWMEEEFPWLKDEKAAIKEFVIKLRKPFLGFCLGCQLLGAVIGGKVGKSKIAEIGMINIELTGNKKHDSLFASFPNSIKALQWHSYEVQGLEQNKHVTILGSSSTTKYQIFKYMHHAYGIQFHIEVKNNTVSQWGCVPEYKNALESSLGPNALEKFDRETQANMRNMNEYSEILYKNFKDII